jgi:hypothetical protein
MTTSATPAPTRPTASGGPAATRTPAGGRDTRAGAATLVAAGLSVATGATQLLHPQDTLAEIDPRTRVMLVGVAVSLWAMSVLYLHLARLARSAGSAGSARPARPGWGAPTAVTGMVLLSLGMLSSAVNGIDLAIFPAVATVANALWFVGSVALAVPLWRSRRVPRAVALLLVLLMPVTIVGSQLGGGVVVGTGLAVVGWLLLRGQLARA